MKIITIESKEAGTRDADRLARLIFNVLTGTRYYDWSAGSGNQILSRPVPNFLSADHLVNQHTVEVVIPCPTKCMVLVPPSLKRWAGEMRNRINRQIRSMFREASKSSVRALAFDLERFGAGSSFTVRDQCREEKLRITDARGGDDGADEQWAWVFLDKFERSFYLHAGNSPIMNDVASILINRDLLASPVPEAARWTDMRWRFTASENAAPDSLNTHYVALKDCALMVPVLSRTYFITPLTRLMRGLYDEWMNSLTYHEQAIEYGRRVLNWVNDWIQSKEHPVSNVPREKLTVRPADRSSIIPIDDDTDHVQERCLVCHARIHDTCWALVKTHDNLLQICDACAVRARGFWTPHLRRVKCDDPAPHLRKETLQMIRLDRKMQQWPDVCAVKCGDRRGLIRNSTIAVETAFVKLWGDMPHGRVVQICEWLESGVGPMHELEDWTSHASVKIFE